MPDNKNKHLNDADIDAIINSAELDKLRGKYDTAGPEEPRVDESDTDSHPDPSPETRSEEPDVFSGNGVDKLISSFRIVYEESANKLGGLSATEEVIKEPDEPQHTAHKKESANDFLSTLRIVYEAPEDDTVAEEPAPEQASLQKVPKLPGQADAPSITSFFLNGLNLDELSKKYGVEPDDTHAELSAREPETKTQLVPPAEQEPAAGTQSKFLDFLGTLLLILSLAVFGVPMMIGKVKRQFSAVVCVLLSVVISFCSYSVFGSYRSAVAAGFSMGTAPEQSTELPFPAKPPLMPEPFSVLKPNTKNTVLPDGILEKYKTVYTFNPDVVGWLKIPNTSIDTLIMQSKNNNFYLLNDYYELNTRYGNAFLDYRNNSKEVSQNSIIYGHTSRFEVQIFYDLYKYMDYNFYINNPVIEFGTLFNDYEWKVFSVYITNVEGKDDDGYFFYYIHPEINKSKFPGYLSQIMQRSRFFSDIGVDENDKILTLSTCVYDNNYQGNKIDSRLVVAARLLRAGESKETDTSTIIDNPNYRRPQAWYSHFGLKNPYANSEKWRQ